MRIWQSRAPSGARFLLSATADQPPVPSLRKLALTRRLVGRSAACIDRSMATPFRSEGVRPDITSGQKLIIDPIIESCAAAMPSAAAAAFSDTAEIVSLRADDGFPVSPAIRGKRSHATIGASIRSPAAAAAARRRLFERLGMGSAPVG